MSKNYFVINMHAKVYHKYRDMLKNHNFANALDILLHVDYHTVSLHNIMLPNHMTYYPTEIIILPNNMTLPHRDHHVANIYDI